MLIDYDAEQDYDDPSDLAPDFMSAVVGWCVIAGFAFTIFVVGVVVGAKFG